MEGRTDRTAVYIQNKEKGFGPFKYQWWTLEDQYKNRILEALYNKFEFLFDKLNVFNTKESVEKYVKPVKISYGSVKG